MVTSRSSALVNTCFTCLLHNSDLCTDEAPSVGLSGGRFERPVFRRGLVGSGHRVVMVQPMAVALVGAIAGIVIALIREVGSRIEQSDMRNQLSKEVEILGKLDRDSPEYAALKNYVSQSVWRMVSEEGQFPARARQADAVMLAVGIITLASYFAYAHADLRRYKFVAEYVAFAGLGVLTIYMAVGTARFVSKWWTKRRS